MSRSTAVSDGARGRAFLRGRRDETGSSLILALVFIVAVALVVTALADWATSDLRNNGTFSSARSLQDVASAATEVAIQSMRYTPELPPSGGSLNASPPSNCWGSTGSVSELPLSDFPGQSIGGATEIAVWCTTLWAPSSINSRVVTISACPLTGSTTATTCASNPTLQAVVTFDDYPTGVSAPSGGQCDVYCGTSMILDNWASSPVVPAVTSTNLGTGPPSGGGTITITGTGFAKGASVNFIQESGGTPVNSAMTGDPTVGAVASPSVTFISSTSISAIVPAVTQGTTYFVTVTTPNGGTSAYSAANGPVYTY
jgi:hypothetical protein